MANAIVANEWSFTKKKRSKLSLASKKQEVSPMVRRSLLDVVTSKERLSIPFKFRWLKFKTGFFGLVIRKGVTI